MEAGSATVDRGKLPVWALGLIPVVLIALALAALVLLDGPGLGERNGVPLEELVVEQTTLNPGEIELTVRNDGPDPVEIAQVSVNDSYVPFEGAGEVGRLGAQTVTVPYPWIEGEAYEIFLLTATGGTILHEIGAAAETPGVDLSFFGLMALLGIYVGVIPITIGMLWLPFVRRVGQGGIRILIALTVGLLGFLAVDTFLEGREIALSGPQGFGGEALVFIGAAVAYLALVGVDSYLRGRRKKAEVGGASGSYLALLVAIGIGLHNLGEGLAIGSAYASGALALGAFLVVGFALHNTTEGLAIVAPIADQEVKLGRLVGLGLIAGAPVTLGAWIGAAAFNASLVAFLFGVGLGAIIQVIVQLWPMMRSRLDGSLSPGVVAGILAGVGIMYTTGLLVSI